ncbi:carboxylesterase family protein [Azospirillum sp. SYSU D00513]|uniref:carboxylesterase/lipase family protein n=1 Tax=Azospirillum sp. SYSU D00513 TaxID=2812561 RepID=UPI001A978F39|nr:carboxylesterase family protein [Azospirillum sp. SYSU D00513]
MPRLALSLTLSLLATVPALLSAQPGAAQAAEAATACGSADAAVACTETGAVRGVAEGATLAFKGIPYAKPPVGDLRWRPPRPAEAWSGVRDGSKTGPSCPQLSGKEVVGSEDCLTVNVWKPQDTPAAQGAGQAAKRPVMVWFTGGGNHSLSGQGTAQYGGVTYDGEAMAARGVVFVSFNYRLGALGFLAHPALDAERTETVSGNYGSLDQIALLGWVRRNIAAFGGDPERVTVFGTSAGGANICALMTAPAAKGLFASASMQSSVPTGCELPTLAEAEARTGNRVVSALACEGGSDVAACLRGKSMAEVVNAVPGTFGVFPRIYGPNVDGHVFPQQPISRIRAGAHVPVIIGNSAEETMQFVDAAGPVTDEAGYAAAVERIFGSKARGAVLARYPATRYGSPRRALVQATTDALFTCTSRRVARAIADAQTKPVFRYLFAHTLENDPAFKAAGINHTIEHPFFYAWKGKYQPTADDLAIQRLMLASWTNLARAGNPNGAGAPSWPAVAAGADTLLTIGAASATAGQGPAEANCGFWDGIELPAPHL